MASDFGIGLFEHSDGFDLKLDGDFDSTSAYELVYAIKKLPDDAENIYVDTDGLKKIHPSGIDVLNGFMSSLDGQPAKVVLKGHNVNQLSLEKACPAHKISNFFLKELRAANI